MKPQHVVSTAVLATGFIVAGCAARVAPTTKSASKFTDASTLEVPATIDKKLFYDFKVKPYAGVRKTVDGLNYYSDLANDNGPNSNQWGIWIERGHAEGFDHGHWFLNLETGALEEYFVHSGGGTFLAAPANGGSLVKYLKLLDRMQEALRITGVPQDAIDYVAKVSDFVKAATPGSVEWEGANQAGDEGSVAYFAKQQADILVDVFHTAPDSHGRSDKDVWFTKGRATVAAGTGIVTIKFAQANPDLAHSCYDVKLLPVGADYDHAIAAATLCSNGGSR